MKLNQGLTEIIMTDMPNTLCIEICALDNIWRFLISLSALGCFCIILFAEAVPRCGSNRNGTFSYLSSEASMTSEILTGQL